MTDVAQEATIETAISAWPSLLERTLFGTDDAGEITALLADFCQTSLEAPLEKVLFYRRGVGAVFGLRIRPGRSIVVKVHRPELVGDLRGVRTVQRRLADLGLPAPRPIGQPTRFGRGLATAEELLDRGTIADGHDPGVRRGLATGLHRFVVAATPMIGSLVLPVAHPFGLPSGELWPPPHDLRFDFGLPGGRWIDELVAAARSTLRAVEGRMVVGHADWRVENLLVDGNEVVAIFDWDSVGLCPEPALVGVNAVGFTASWNDGRPDPYPSAAESAAFVADYEAARGRAFTSSERDVLDAASLYRLAYGARCEYSDAVLGLFPDRDIGGGWIGLLCERARPGR